MASMNEIRLEIAMEGGLLDDENGQTLLQENGDALEVDGYGFSNVWQDVRLGHKPVNFRYGISGSSLTDRVASVGSLSFALDNSEQNSAKLNSYYSPGHANARPGFDIERAARLIFNNGIDHYIWRGRVASIVPSMASTGPQVSEVTCEDIMGEIGDLTNLGIQEIQSGVSSDEIYASIVDLLANPPGEADFSPNQNLITYMFAQATNSNQTAVNEIVKVALSTFDYFSTKSDEVYGGLIASQTYNDRIINNDASDLILDNTMNALSPSRDRQRNLDTAIAIAHPIQVSDVEEIIYSLTEPFFIFPGQEIKVVVNYSDPANLGTPIAAINVNTEPVVFTDYGSSAKKQLGLTGTGSVLTTVTVIPGATSAEVIYGRTGNVGAWVNKHNIRGYPVRMYDAVETTASSDHPTANRSIRLDLVYQPDVAFARVVADLAIYLQKDAQTYVDHVTFRANNSQALIDAAAEITFGNRIEISEAQTGLENYGAYVNGVSGVISSREIIDITYQLEKAPPAGHWLLGDATWGLLGDTTTLRGI